MLRQVFILQEHHIYLEQMNCQKRLRHIKLAQEMKVRHMYRSDFNKLVSVSHLQIQIDYAAKFYGNS